MKTTTIPAAAVAAFLPAADAWQIVLKGTDGRQGALYGTLITGCVNLVYSPALNVKEAVFSSSFGATAYTLYQDMGCTGINSGKLRETKTISPTSYIRSYKVHSF